MKQAVCGATIGLGMIAGAASAAINYSNNFNTAATSTDASTPGTFAHDFKQNNSTNFYQNGNPGTPAGATSVGGGVNNTNAIDLFNNSGDATAILTTQSADLTGATASYKISAYFRNQTGVTGNTAAGAFQLGFGSDTTTSFNGGQAFVTGRIRGNGKLEFQTGAAGGGTTPFGTTATAASLTDGGLYFLSVTLTRSATANTFSGTVNLYSSDSAGTLSASPILSTSSTAITTTADLYNDTTLFAGFRAAGSTDGTPTFTSSGYGANLVDSFSVAPVPEPASVTVLAAGGLLLRRRRTR